MEQFQIKRIAEMREKEAQRLGPHVVPHNQGTQRKSHSFTRFKFIRIRMQTWLSDMLAYHLPMTKMKDHRPYASQLEQYGNSP